MAIDPYADLLATQPEDKQPEPTIRFLSPVSGVMGGGFNDKRSHGRHAAGDLFAPAGDPIVAPGNMEFIQGRQGGTNLRNNDWWSHWRDVDTGVEYRFAHHGPILHQPGEIVRRGEQWNTIGDAINDPHLHMAVHDPVAGQNIDWVSQERLKRGKRLYAGSGFNDLEGRASKIAATVKPQDDPYADLATPTSTKTDPYADFAAPPPAATQQIGPDGQIAQGPSLINRGIDLAKNLIQQPGSAEESAVAGFTGEGVGDFLKTAPTLGVTPQLQQPPERKINTVVPVGEEKRLLDATLRKRGILNPEQASPETIARIAQEVGLRFTPERSVAAPAPGAKEGLAYAPPIPKGMLFNRAHDGKMVPFTELHPIEQAEISTQRGLPLQEFVRGAEEGATLGAYGGEKAPPGMETWRTAGRYAGILAPFIPALGVARGITGAAAPLVASQTVGGRVATSGLAGLMVGAAGEGVQQSKQGAQLTADNLMKIGAAGANTALDLMLLHYGGELVGPWVASKAGLTDAILGKTGQYLRDKYYRSMPDWYFKRTAQGGLPDIMPVIDPKTNKPIQSAAELTEWIKTHKPEDVTLLVKHNPNFQKWTDEAILDWYKELPNETKSELIDSNPGLRSWAKEMQRGGYQNRPSATEPTQPAPQPTQEPPTPGATPVSEPVQVAPEVVGAPVTPATPPVVEAAPVVEPQLTKRQIGAQNAKIGKQLKDIDDLLINDAIVKAQDANDEWNLGLFQNMSGKKIQRAERDLLNDYLFGDTEGRTIDLPESKKQGRIVLAEDVAKTATTEPTPPEKSEPVKAGEFEGGKGATSAPVPPAWLTQIAKKLGVSESEVRKMNLSDLTDKNAEPTPTPQENVQAEDFSSPEAVKLGLTADSEVGEGVVLYHGSARPEFNEFIPEFINPYTSHLGRGFYFSENPDVAREYSNSGFGGSVKQVHLPRSGFLDLTSENGIAFIKNLAQSLPWAKNLDFNRHTNVIKVTQNIKDLPEQVSKAGYIGLRYPDNWESLGGTGKQSNYVVLDLSKLPTRSLKTFTPTELQEIYLRVHGGKYPSWPTPITRAVKAEILRRQGIEVKQGDAELEMAATAEDFESLLSVKVEEPTTPKVYQDEAGWWRVRGTEVKTSSKLLAEKAAGRVKATPQDTVQQAGGEGLTRESVGNVLANQLNNKGKSADKLLEKWVPSNSFELMEIPVDSVFPATTNYEGKSKSKGPIIVDQNIGEVGRFEGNYGTPPDVIVVDGKYRLKEAKDRSEKTIQAYVGNEAKPFIDKAISVFNEKKIKAEKAIQDYLANPNGMTLMALNIETKGFLSKAEVANIREQGKKVLSERKQPNPPPAGAKGKEVKPVHEPSGLNYGSMGMDAAAKKYQVKGKTIIGYKWEAVDYEGNYTSGIQKSKNTAREKGMAWARRGSKTELAERAEKPVEQNLLTPDLTAARALRDKFGTSRKVGKPTGLISKESPLSRASARGDLRGVIKALGGIKSTSNILKNFEPEQRKKLIGLIRTDGMGADVLADTINKEYQHLGYYETDADLIRTLVDGSYKKLLNKNIHAEEEAYYAEQVAREAERTEVPPDDLTEAERIAEEEVISAEKAGRIGEIGDIDLDDKWWTGEELGVVAPKAEQTSLEIRTEALTEAYPELDAKSLALVLKTFPDGPTDQIVRMAKDQKLFDQLRRQRLQKMSDSGGDSHQMQSLPGVGGLFGEEPKYTLKQARALAPTFYSQMATYLETKLPGKGTSPDLANLIEGWAAKGQFKADELKFSGLLPWLREQQGSVMRHQIIEKLKEGMVAVKVVEKGDIEPKPITKLPEGYFVEKPPWSEDRWFVFEPGIETNNSDALEVGTGWTKEEAIQDALRRLTNDLGKKETKFQSYLTDLPESFTNRREILLTVPADNWMPEGWRVEKTEDGMYAVYNPLGSHLGNWPTRESAMKSQLRQQGSPVFKVPSGHAYNDPAADVNRFAHVFTADWVDPKTGGKYLVVTELQSDWAAKGRREGYKGEAIDDALKKYPKLPRDPDTWNHEVLSESGLTTQEISNVLDHFNNASYGAPPLPFAKNWHEVALKQVVRKAAEEGYDGVMVVNGEMVKQRYDLSRVVDSVKFWTPIGEEPGYTFLQFKKDGVHIEGLHIGEEQSGQHYAPGTYKVPDVKLSEAVGKDLAEKILGERQRKPQEYSGEQLKIGGTWANNLYDKTIPDYLRKYVRQWGAEVSKKDVETTPKLNYTHEYQGPDRTVDEIREAFTYEANNVTEKKQLKDIWDAVEKTGVTFKQAIERYGSPWAAKLFGGELVKVTETQPLTHVPIPQSMRDSVLYRGQPLYKEKTGEKEGTTDADSPVLPGKVGDSLFPQDEKGQRRQLDYVKSRVAQIVPAEEYAGFWENVTLDRENHGTLEHKDIQKYAAMFGVQSVIPVKGAGFDGVLVPTPDGPVVLIDRDNPEGFTKKQVAGHEIFHELVRLKDPEALRLVGMVDTKSPAYKKYLTQFENNFRSRGVEPPSGSSVAEEIAGDFFAGIKDKLDIYGNPFALKDAFTSPLRAFEAKSRISFKAKDRLQYMAKRGPPGGKKSGADRVWETYDKNMAEFNDLGKVKLKDLHAKIKRLTVDTAGNLKRDLLKQAGNEGRIAVMMHELSLGASAKAQQIMEDATKRIYKGLSKADEVLLNKALRANRDLAILSYKPGHVVTGGHTIAELQEALDTKVPPHIMARVKEYSKVMDENLEAMKEAGLLTDKGYEALKNTGDYLKTNYIQHIDPDRTGFDYRGRKITVPDSGIKKLDEGSTQAVQMNSRVLMAEVIGRTQGRILRNNANEALYQFITNNPDNPFGFKLARIEKRVKGGDKWKDVAWEDVPDDYDMTEEKPKEKITYRWHVPPGHTEVSVMREGKRIRMVLPNKYAQEWVQADPMFSPTATAILGWALGTKILKAVATGMNPGFALTNLPRDIAHIWLVTNEYSTALPVFGPQMATDLATVFMDAVRRTGRYRSYIDQGGGMSFMTQQGQLGGPAGRPIMMKQVGDTWKIKRFQWPILPTLKKVQTVLGWLGETSEIWTRLAVRERAIKNGKSEQEATWIARNYLDFAQGGSFAKAADSMIPYLNAGIQGTRKVFQAASDNPSRFLWKVAQIGAIAIGLYLANSRWNKECWDSVPEWEKRTNWIITTPIQYKDKAGDKRYLYFRIAKDQGQRAFAALFEAFVAKMAGEKFDYKYVVKALGDALPLMPFDKTPPVFNAGMGYYANIDFWRNEHYWKGQKVKPSSEIDKFTSPLAVKIGEYTGLSPTRLQGAFGQLVPPTNTYAGLVGAGIRQLMDPMTEKEREKSWAEILSNNSLLNKLVRPTSPFEPFKAKMEEAGIEENTRRYDQRRKLDKLVEENMDKPVSERNRLYFQFAKEQPIMDRDRLIKYARDHEKFQDIPNRRWWLELKHLPPEAGATQFWARYKDAPPEEQKQLYRQMLTLPGIKSDRFMRQFIMLKRQGK